MGLLFLTRHESRVVLSDRDEDPSWRPLPGSELDRAWDGDDSDRSFEEAFADGVRSRQRALNINAASKHWRKSARMRALLITTTEQDRHFVSGVGNVSTKGRRGWLGSAVVRLSDWRVFDQSIPLTDLLAALPSRTRPVVDRLFDEEDSREMPPGAARAVWTAMRGLVSNLDELLASLPAFPSPTRFQVDELTTFDASLSALRFFSSGWRNLEPVQNPPPPTPLASRLESIAVRDEDEVITDDSSSFLNWDSDGRTNGGWYLFRSPDGERELRVKNINFKNEETASGADLVYVRADPESVVLVQYKLLTANKDSHEYFFRDTRGRLLGQVKRMLSFSTVQESNAEGVDDYRISNDIGFVKFVVPTKPFDSDGSLTIPGGHYHPAEGILRMLAQPGKGPRRGNIHRVEEWRSLDGETFAKLLRDAWVGSAGEVTEELLAILGLARNPLFLAVEEAATDS